jgi:hypothetical protein
VYHIAGRLRAVLLLVGVPLLLSLVGAIGVCVAGMTDNTIGTTYNNFGWMWIAGVAAADIVITVVVLTALFNEASKTTFEPTDTIIRRLIKIACESQLPPTIMAIAMLLDFAIQGDSYYVVFFEMIQGKLYVVGMLYVLNKHADMRSQSDRGGMAARVAHTPAARPLTMNHLKQDIGRAAIHVQTETYVESHTINPEFGRRRNIEPKFREPSVSGDTETGSTSGTSLGGPTHTNYDSSTNYDHQNFDIPNQSKVGLTASSPRNEKQF